MTDTTQAQPVPNYRSSNEVLASTSDYFARLATICHAEADRAPQQRAGLVLRQVGEAARSLSNSLERYQVDASMQERHAQMQYTSEMAPPKAEGVRLMTEGGEPDLDAWMAAIQNACARWKRIHEELTARASTSENKDLHENVAGMVTTWAQDQQRAFLEQSDL